MKASYFSFKGIQINNEYSRHYLLTTMPGGWSVSPQNTFGVSGLNSVAAKSNTMEVNGDRLFKR